LKTKKATNNKDADAKYNKKITELEKENTALEKRIDGAGKTKTSMWYNFKKDFNRDMDKLGEHIKNIDFKSKNIFDNNYLLLT
jgi:hypothetical protein